MWQYPPGAGVVFAIADFIPRNPPVGMIVLLVAAITLQSVRVVTLVAATVYALYVVGRCVSGRTLMPIGVVAANKS